MLNPLKLLVIIAGGVVVLAVVPYGITRLTTGSKPEPKPVALTFVPEQAAKPEKAGPMEELPAPKLEDKLDVLSAKKTTTPPLANAPAAKVSVEKAAPKPEKAPAKEVAELPRPIAPAPVVTQPAPEPAPVVTPTPKPEIPYNADVEKAQHYLAKLGYNIGKIDGKRGQKTELYLTSFQKEKGLRSKGEADAATLEQLEKAVAALDAEPADADSAQSENEKSDIAKGSSQKEEKVSEKTIDSKVVAKSDDPQFVILRKSSGSAKKVDPGPVPTLKKVAHVKRLQEKLAEAKLYSDTPDGKWGEKTILAMKDFQEKYDLKVTGKPNTETWKKMHDLPVQEWTVVKADRKAPASFKEIASAPKPQESPRKVLTEKVEITDAKKPVTKTVDEKAVTIKVADLASATKSKQPAVVQDVPRIEEPARPAPVVAEVSAPAPAAAAETLEVSKPVGVGAEPKVVAAAPVQPVAPAEEVPSLSGAAEKPAPAIARVAEPAAPIPASDTPPGKVVVKLNADAGTADLAALATPASVGVGPLVNPAAPVIEKRLEVAQPVNSASEPAKEVAAPPKEVAVPVKEIAQPANLADQPVQVVATASAESVLVKVQAPKRDAAPAKQVAAVPANSNEDLPPAAARAKAKSEVEQAQARIAMVSNDPRYEMEKYAPKMLESVNGLVDKLKSNAGSSDPEAARKNLQLIDQELEQAKLESIRKKAERKVGDVEVIYKNVKSRYSDQIKKAPLADLMGKIDNGYTAMKADFKKGNYDPIVERCDGFKLQIEILANEAAKSYLESELNDKKVTARLSKSTLSEIEDLRKSNKYNEAAELLSSSLKKDEKASSSAKSSSESSSKKRRG